MALAGPVLVLVGWATTAYGNWLNRPTPADDTNGADIGAGFLIEGGYVILVVGVCAGITGGTMLMIQLHKRRRANRDAARSN